MKILQLNKYFYQKGGAETVFFNTISTLENRGHQVIPFALKNKKNKFSEYASYFVDYPELSESNIWTKITNIPAFIYNRQAAKQLERLILDKKPDIAHIHLLFNSLSVSILPVLQKYRIPTVMTVHDYRLICPAYTLTNGKGKICELCKDRHFIHCTLNRCSNGNLTNSMLQKNSEILKQGSIEIAEESERAIVDVATLQKTNKDIIDTLDQVIQIHENGRVKRQEAEVELANIEKELKEKMIELKVK